MKDDSPSARLAKGKRSSRRRVPVVLYLRYAFRQSFRIIARAAASVIRPAHISLCSRFSSVSFNVVAAGFAVIYIGVVSEGGRDGTL